MSARSRLIYLYLCIFPLLLFLSGFILKKVHGPYYLWWFDQSYAYLINSLNVAQLKEVGGVAHLGTPLHIFGALIIKIKYILSGSNVDFPGDVFAHSESYLQLLHTMLIIINSVALFILGLFTFRFTQNIYLSLLLQLSPLVSYSIFYGSLIVSSEQFLILISLCLIGASVFYLYKINIESFTPLKFIILLSLISGLGLASKLNFLPLIFIPLIIIRGVKYKFIFLILTALIFSIFLIPLLSQYKMLVRWIKDLLIQNDNAVYALSVVSSFQNFLENVLKIFYEDFIFSLAYIIAMTTLVIGIFKKNNTTEPLICKAKILLTAIFVSFNIQIFLVGKYYAQYFMLPSLMLSELSLVVSIIVLTSAFQKNLFKKTNLLYAIIILISLAYGIKMFYKWNEILKWQIHEARRTENFIKTNHSSDDIIASPFSPNLECTLSFSTHFGGKQIPTYKNILDSSLVNKIYYDPWIKKINALGGNSEIDSILRNNEKLIFQTTGKDFFDNFLEELKKNNNIKIIGTKELFKSDGEHFVYEVLYKFESH